MSNSFEDYFKQNKSEYLSECKNVESVNFNEYYAKIKPVYNEKYDKTVVYNLSKGWVVVGYRKRNTLNYLKNKVVNALYKTVNTLLNL